MLLRKSYNLFLLHIKKKWRLWDCVCKRLRNTLQVSIEISIWCKKILRKYLWDRFVHWTLRQCLSWTLMSRTKLPLKCNKKLKGKCSSLCNPCSIKLIIPKVFNKRILDLKSLTIYQKGLEINIKKMLKEI